MRQPNLPGALNLINAHYNAALTSGVVDWCVKQQKAGPELSYRDRFTVEMQTNCDFGRVATVAA